VLATPAGAWAHGGAGAAADWWLGATLLVVLALYARGLTAL
jgi:hypothetical protein